MTLSALILIAGIFGSPSPDDPENPRVLIAQRTDQDISIDGYLSEADWQTAAFASDFLQFEPREGQAPSQRTEVRMLYGNNSIYIGAKMFDTEPDKIWRTLGRRDSFNKADWFFVSIDGYLNRKEAFTFAVNAAGVQLDGITTRELNSSWNAVWDSAVRMTADGWVVEMRIPYSMLRFSEAREQSWGINFRRVIPRTSETLEWALVRRTEREGGVVAKYGELQGLEQLAPRRNLQFTPYTVSRVMTEEGAPGEVNAFTDADFGADLKIGLSSNMTLDVAINPDFGQVDSDPAQLNLSAFETFNRERRPFFVEGSSTYNFSLGTGSSLFYTRRIGSTDAIIGATKLSGRTDGGLSFGVISAATGARFNPNRYYGATRIRQDVGKYSSFGGIVTLYNRNLPGDGLTSVTGGVDWDMRLDNNTYKISGYASLSDRRFREQSSLSARGYAASTELERIRGDWTYGITFTGIDDTFNPNDAGRLRQNNFLRISSNLAHQFNGGKAAGPFQRASARVWTFSSRTWSEGIYRGTGGFLGGNIVTQSFQNMDASIFGDYLFGGYDVNETRGLGAWAAPREFRIRTSFKTDSRRQWTLKPKIAYTFTELGGTELGLDLKGDWDVSTRLSMSASVGVKRENNMTAWASNESISDSDGQFLIGETSTSPSDLGANDFRELNISPNLAGILAEVPFFEDTDTYYVSVFGERDTRVLDFTLRSNITFSPTLSLEIYAQLFTAQGRYNDFSVLTDPDNLVPIDNYPKRRDFTSTSFQTNTVFRWEYRPGSTLFVVWTHARVENFSVDPFDQTTNIGFGGGTFSQVPNAFGIFPENVFLIKLNYTFLR